MSVYHCFIARLSLLVIPPFLLLPVAAYYLLVLVRGGSASTTRTTLINVNASQKWLVEAVILAVVRRE
ncbi:hypothetical protein D9758_017649 [Tetrapyrgos nigripes]|uniref:Uncharacterized protein n=1 Tax=Tetrapyrgos nigripes TaxID=182062 RepID=A0A8H5FL59_9AGAR|nr:hypothetical protein D9758_017649 [Tetrapyrgos nigripes]